MDINRNLKKIVVSDAAGFDSLEADWDDLHESSDSSIFQSYSWLRTWWRHFGEGSSCFRLHIVLVYEQNNLLAIAPFYLHSKKISSLAHLKELCFIGTGFSDYLDVILKPGLEAVLLEELACHIGSLWRRLDAIKLQDIPDGSVTRRVFGDLLKSNGIGVRVEVCDACPRLKMGATWSDTLDALNGNQRRHLRTRCRQLHEEYSIDYECVEDENILEEAMAEFVEMHQGRMTDTGRNGAYAEPRNERFHRDACRNFLRKGWLFLSFLTLSDKRVAATCSYLYKGRVYFHLSGIGAVGDAWKYSPGIVLHCLCMQEAIRRGVTDYDFMRGTEDYKYRFGSVDFPNWRIECRRVRPSVRILGAIGACLGRVRRKIRGGAGGASSNIKADIKI